MTPERYQQIGLLFNEALEQVPEQRSAWLHKTCGADDDLRLEVEKLLTSQGESGEFLSRPAMQVAAEILAQNQTPTVPGKQIKRYQILSLIGSGGMGQVYLARDTRLGRLIALKLLPSHLTQDTELVRRFKKEAQAIVSLNHPNILTIHDFGETKGVHYIATEYVEGKTLRQHLDEQKISLTELLDVAIQIVSALEAAHHAGIVHRDIKPENIMIRPDGFVKVLDFGLARITKPTMDGGSQSNSSITSPGSIIGTSTYMSPEQARGQHVNHRTDLYSLGVMLYEMCAGRPPFTGANSVEILINSLHQEPPPLSNFGVPLQLEQLINHAMRKDRESRIPDAGTMLRELKKLRHSYDSEAV
jgi:eukaryotic-like serine/threonine-protein kinase